MSDEIHFSMLMNIVYRDAIFIVMLSFYFFGKYAQSTPISLHHLNDIFMNIKVIHIWEIVL